MLDPIRRRARRSSSRLSALAVVLMAALMLSACGGDDDDGAQIEWKVGTPPGTAAVEPTPQTPSQPDATAPVQEQTTTLDEEPPSSEGTPPPADVASSDQPSGPLTAEERAELQPNELGQIPILEYHVFTTNPEEEDQFTRLIDDFRADLEWLYEHDFYVVPLRDVILNQINAPAGKRPVALTFDDSPVSQFRYLIQDDGTVEIDPNSAVGVMETFYAQHPDFGRGGLFGVLPHNCFYGQGTVAEEEQIEYCDEKVSWLVENGYEVGNHTLNHTNLRQVDDATFEEEVGGAVEALQAMDPGATADILVMPNGAYPDGGENETQMAMIEDGFAFNGIDVKLLGCLMVGANPTVSPVSVEWDPIWIPRIQAFDDADEWGSSAYWFAAFESDPTMLYVSDGDPHTITIPTTPPPALDGTFDPAKADGKEVIEYDPETGEAL